MDLSSPWHVAKVRPGRVDVYDGDELVESIDVPPGAGLRDLLAASRWRPTGQTVPGSGHRAIYVYPIAEEPT